MSFGHLSDFEKGKITQAQEDMERFDGMIVDMRRQLTAEIKARDMEIKRLRDTLEGAAKSIEAMAFRMPPPSHYTTHFVGIATAMRNQVWPAKATRPQDPREHYDTDLGGDDRGGG